MDLALQAFRHFLGAGLGLFAKTEEKAAKRLDNLALVLGIANSVLPLCGGGDAIANSASTARAVSENTGCQIRQKLGKLSQEADQLKTEAAKTSATAALEKFKKDTLEKDLPEADFIKADVATKTPG